MPEDKKKKKVTRIMKVTLDEDEFEKYDKGLTHSDSGLRNESGRLSALPDIAPVSEDDLPRRTVVRTQKVYVQPKEPTLGQMVKREIKYAIADEVYDAINDPRKRAIIISRAKRFWREYIRPLFSSDEKDEPRYTTKAEQIMAQKQQQAEVVYQVETVNENRERIVVTGEQAEQLVNAMRQKARELTSMIYLLSNIVVKDEKSDTDYVLEESFLKQLLSEEATNTMRSLVEHRQLLDAGTALCFEDWLSGYIRTGDQRVPIPAMTGKSESTADENMKCSVPEQEE